MMMHRLRVSPDYRASSLAPSSTRWSCRPATAGAHLAGPIAATGHCQGTALLATGVPQRRRRRRSAAGACRSTAKDARVGVFPAKQRQAKVELPAIMVQLFAADVLSPDQGPPLMESLDAAVSNGITTVVLSEEGAGAAAMYEAAVKVKDALRGRADLLLEDRTDIAAAVEAEGVVLTDQGVPVVVARKMLAGAPLLIGKVATSPEGASRAAADGANLVLLRSGGGGAPDADAIRAAKEQQRSGNSIPVVVSWGEAADSRDMGTSWTPAMDGVCVPLPQLSAAAASCAPGLSSVSDGDAGDWAAALVMGLRQMQQQQADAEARQAGGDGGGASPSAFAPSGDAPDQAGRRLLSADSEKLMQEEADVLKEILSLLEEVAPGLDGLQLLSDALRQLQDLFLVVVVGEFNSGKSSVINALLGRKFLKEGVLPTTNEISILRYCDPGQERLVQQSDGLFVRYLPAQLLNELNIVDTPGTNVILERQQRLTEEYVPRADLVLFTMSCDRAFSESEVRFLEYIRQWRKKIVFVVNKVDVLSSVEEQQAIRDFVATNAKQLLQLDDPNVLLVSARQALRAKQACGEEGLGSAKLATHPDWERSNFATFQDFICNFLLGDIAPAAASAAALRQQDYSASSVGRGEGIRLKLQTPLFVADALLKAARQSVAAELAAAQAELAAVQAVTSQLESFEADMAKDAALQRQVCGTLLQDVVAKTDRFVDKTLQLSNFAVLTTYLISNTSGKAAGSGSGSETDSTFVFRGYQADVAAPLYEQLRGVVNEHASWLAANVDNQKKYYTRLVARRAKALGPGYSVEQALAGAIAELAAPSSSNNGNGAPPDVSDPAAPGSSKALPPGAESASVAAVAEFSPRAAAALLDQELKEVVLGTASTAIGAPSFGLWLATHNDTAWQEVAALMAGGFACYVAVQNLPLRRSELKSKVATVATNFVDKVQANMAGELKAAANRLRADVLTMVAPLEAAYSAEVQRLTATDARMAALEAELEELQKRAASL